MARPKKAVETATKEIKAEKSVIIPETKKSSFDPEKKYVFKNTHCQHGFGLIVAGIPTKVTEEVYNNLKEDIKEL